MIWCRFKVGNKVAYGIVEGDTVVEVEGSPFETYSRTSKTHPLSSVKLEIPVVPPTCYAAGGVNYPDHVAWAAEAVGIKPEFPDRAQIGYRAGNALIAHEEAIIIPRDASEEVDYEGELVAVIGKKCRRVTEAEALDYVLGYTIGNDVSERNWQRIDRGLWRAKNTDTFAPLGPWIATGLIPEDLHCKVTLSGKVVSEYDVRTAIFGVATHISVASQYLTLHPGDIFWMGTEGATHHMKDGDIVEIEIAGIGVLRNPVVRER